MIQNVIHCYTQEGWQCTFEQQGEFLAITATDLYGIKKSFHFPRCDEAMKRAEKIALSNDRFGIHVFEKKEGTVILLGRVGLLGGGFWRVVGKVSIIAAGAGLVVGGAALVVLSGGIATPIAAAAAGAGATAIVSAGASITSYGLSTSSDDITAGDLAFHATTGAVAGAASSAVSSAGGYASGRAVAAVSDATGPRSFSTQATRQISSSVVSTTSAATAAVIAPGAAGMAAAATSAVVQRNFEARGANDYKAVKKDDLQAQQREASSKPTPKKDRASSNEKAASSVSKGKAENPQPKQTQESPAKVPHDDSPKDPSNPTANTPDKDAAASTIRGQRSAYNKPHSSKSAAEAANRATAQSDSHGLSAQPARHAPDQQALRQIEDDNSAYRQLESALHGRPELLKTVEFAKSKNLHKDPKFSKMLEALGSSEENKLSPELLGKLAELEVERLATTTAEPAAQVIEQRVIDSVQEGETLDLRGKRFKKQDNILYRLKGHRKLDYLTRDSFSDSIRALIDEFLRTENEKVDRRQEELENEYGDFLRGEGL